MPVSKLFFTVVLSITVKLSFCQGSTQLQVSAGASIPIGAFADTDYGNSASLSLAGTGFFVDAEIVSNKTAAHFKPAALLGFDFNFYKINTVLDNYRRAKSYFDWTGTHGNWITVSLMPGLQYSATASGKMVFNAGLFTGLAVIESPGATITGVLNQPGYTGGAESKQSSKWAFAVASRLNTGIQLKAGKRTTLDFRAGVIYLKPTFKEITATYKERYTQTGSNLEQVSISRFTSTFTQTVINLHVGAGLVFNL